MEEFRAGMELQEEWLSRMMEAAATGRQCREGYPGIRWQQRREESGRHVASMPPSMEYVVYRWFMTCLPSLLLPAPKSRRVLPVALLCALFRPEEDPGRYVFNPRPAGLVP